MLDAAITNRELLSMPRILGFHEVEDVQHWLSSPQREEFFGPLDVTEIKTYAMEHDGVIPETLVILVES
ncbi:MAG: hypothetical protein ACLP01_22810 [Solirubrobacteraceae bacterium]